MAKLMVLYRTPKDVAAFERSDGLEDATSSRARPAGAELLVLK